MKAAARFAIALLLMSAPMAWARQDASSSSESTTQSENGKVPNTHQEDSSAAEQNQAPRKSDAASGIAGKSGKHKPSATRPGSKAHKHPSAAPAMQAPPVEEEPRKIVIHRGGASEPVAQIIPGMSLEEARRQRQESEDLLAAADSDIKKLADRHLNSSQLETVSQIHHFMEVARAALKDGDIQRAHTLAQKAQLLSDDLLKQ
jgi:hypothetical protein